MLKPAILYKDYLEKALYEYYYSNDMMYFMGHIYNSPIHINNEDGCSTDMHRQYAVVDSNGEPIGYIGYTFDLYSSCAYNFGAFSFQRGNPTMGRDLCELLESLLKKFHRVEFRAVSGNPAIRGYDKFLELHKDIGRKIIMKDVFKDSDGNYRDNYIYEFINDDKKGA